MNVNAWVCRGYVILEKQTEFGRATKGNKRKVEKLINSNKRASDVFLLFEILHQNFKQCICAKQALL